MKSSALRRRARHAVIATKRSFISAADLDAAMSEVERFGTDPDEYDGFGLDLVELAARDFGALVGEVRR